MSAPGSDGGWTMVSETDGAAAVLGALVALEPAAAYTKSALAEAADVPRKTLYLAETLERFESAGLLERVDPGEDEVEARFRIVTESPLYEAARAFDAAARPPGEPAPGAE